MCSFVIHFLFSIICLLKASDLPPLHQIDINMQSALLLPHKTVSYISLQYACSQNVVFVQIRPFAVKWIYGYAHRY